MPLNIKDDRKLCFKVLLHKSSDLFLNPGHLDAKTMCAIFQVKFWNVVFEIAQNIFLFKCLFNVNEKIKLQSFYTTIFVIICGPDSKLIKTGNTIC